MTKDELRELQLVQITIMDEIHRLCVKHDLRYYMIGGTALGSIRHKGFIPWDVDIDIAMPRTDYEKFINLSHELSDKFECRTYKTDEIFYSPHILVVLKNSYIEFVDDNLNPSYKRFGIYVDILPLDQVSNKISEQKIQKKRLNLIKKIKYYKESRIYLTNSCLVKFCKRCLRNIFKIVSYKYLNQKQQEIAQMYNNLPDTGIWCSTLSHYKYEKLCMPKKVFGTPRLYDFEGRRYYGPEDMETYLKQIFGDYMKLPSKQIQTEQMEMIVSARWI